MHHEILDTLNWVDKNQNNPTIFKEIMAKAKLQKGLTHREASFLFTYNNPDDSPEIFALASQIKQSIYGKRVVLFAPLYLSNHCVNGCTYCPYHAGNTTMPRQILTQEQIAQEVIALQNMGHKRIVIEAGEHPTHTPMSYILDSINTIYKTKTPKGEIRRINVNIAASTIDEYRQLVVANIGTYILFQETYHPQVYQKYHPKGPKANYDYHRSAMDRAMTAGLEDIGLGALFGLYDHRYELAAMLLHAKELEDKFNIGPHTMSVPRIRKAVGVNVDGFEHAVDDETFLKIIAVLRIAVPYTGIILSTRENEDLRNTALNIGVSQISGASRTTVGGYHSSPQETHQFETHDNRTLREVVDGLVRAGHIPSFCTACYAEGRRGEDFMALCKAGHIGKLCQQNAEKTLKEYLENYGDL